MGFVVVYIYRKRQDIIHELLPRKRPLRTAVNNRKKKSRVDVMKLYRTERTLHLTRNSDRVSIASIPFFVAGLPVLKENMPMSMLTKYKWVTA